MQQWAQRILLKLEFSFKKVDVEIRTPQSILEDRELNRRLAVQISDDYGFVWEDAVLDWDSAESDRFSNASTKSSDNFL